MSDMTEILKQTQEAVNGLNQAIEKMFELMQNQINKASDTDKDKVNIIKGKVERALQKAKLGDVNGINKIIKEIKDEYQGNK